MTEENISLQSIEPKQRELVLAQYMEHEKNNLQGNNPYWHAPDHWNRWLVRLDCGCITEVLTHFGYDTPPTEHKYSKFLGEDEGPIFKRTFIGHPRSLGGWCILGDTADHRESRKVNPFPDGCCKPSGTIWCSAHDDQPPWRNVEKYIARKSYYNREQGKIKHYWTVVLSCGHCYSPHSADEEWSPGTPPHVDRETIAEMARSIERAERGDKVMESERFIREQIEHNGFMVCSPAMEEQCHNCVNLRQIAEYRLIGKLSDKPWRPPAKLKSKPEPTAEEVKAQKLAELRKVESSLKRLEAKAERLRREAQ